MTNAQSIISVGLLVVVGVIAAGLAFLKYLGGKLDPLFNKAITRAIVIGLVLLGVQIAGFFLSR